MVQELKIPQAGESIQEVQIGQWLKKEGEWVERDENIVELETDKASMDLPSPAAGLLAKILKHDGEAAVIGETIALIDDAAQPGDARVAEAKPGPLPAPRVIMPAAQRLLAEHDLQSSDVQATGPGGRLLKEDVLRHIGKLHPTDHDQASPQHRAEPAVETAASPATEAAAGIQRPGADLQVRPHSKDGTEDRSATPRETPPAAATDEHPDEHPLDAARQEEVVPMTLIRRRIAETLVRAQHEAALLTTFNEIDMSAVMRLRSQYRARFQEKYEIKLGFLSFFTKAVIEGLKEFPAINARIRDREIVYHNYFDIGIAIGGGRGLVVPALRNAERMSFAEIEQKIADFAERAKANKIRPEELEGGTFTITNGGIYGSLLSTPLINPPQSGVLGLHSIQDRPVAVDGQVVIRPMMYVALTYDHRIVDGREAVTFLRRLKETIEDPARMLLEV